MRVHKSPAHSSRSVVPVTRAIRTPLDEAVELDLTSAESLDAIVAATANARVVLLGEATHGDGATFAAKAAIARHLHEHAGFDVLAWEAGSYDCWRTDRAFAAGADPIEALELGLHQIWVATRENGFHFELRGDSWIDNRFGDELKTLLTRACTSQAGEPVVFP